MGMAETLSVFCRGPSGPLQDPGIGALEPPPCRGRCPWVWTSVRLSLGASQSQCHQQQRAESCRSAVLLSSFFLLDFQLRDLYSDSFPVSGGLGLPGPGRAWSKCWE